MNKLHAIEIPIWHTGLYVFFGEDKDKCLKELNKAKKGKIKQSSLDTTRETMENANGVFVQSIVDYYNLLWMPVLPHTIDEFTTLIHEIEHATFFILDNAGMVHTKESDEAYAHTQGYIFSEIDNLINKISDKQDKK